MNGDRCTGHCCRKFHMFTTVDMLKADMASEHPRWNPEQAKILIDMLIPIVVGVDGGLYTCRHLNTETGDCMNYEGRPDMCRDYPYEQTCAFKECTFEQARNPPAREGATKLKVIQ